MTEQGADQASQPSGSGVLTRERLLDLLFKTESVSDRLIVSPLLDPTRDVSNGTIDVRLGSYFIVTRTARIGGLDPFVAQRQLRGYQERLHVPYGKSLWIHPGTFVLGVTLEYIRLPENVYAEVSARSSWARVGLNIASAVAIHPGFVGCLTLELVNAGNTPVSLAPGIRIGQLVLHDAPGGIATPPTGKYVAQIEPQFTSIGDEAEELQQWSDLAL